MLEASAVFKAVVGVHNRVKGSYAVVAIIAGFGLLAFRDPHGIRPLCLGYRQINDKKEWMVASESVALEGNGFHFERDIAPGEAVIVSSDGQIYSQLCAQKTSFTPCIFEYVYLARPDSCIDGVPVYEVRLRMGDYLAEKILRELDVTEIDVVMPIPDSSRPAAMQVAKRLGIPYREGFYKNRYVGRTFIMPGQAVRKKSVRQKLNAMSVEFQNKRVLIVDDSIVRGTTSSEIVQMARDAGAAKVIFASAAPPVRFPNVYGIDMPTRNELVAYGRSVDEVRHIIGADHLVYQDVADLKQAVSDISPALKNFEASCFDGTYITGDIDTNYLDNLETNSQYGRQTADPENQAEKQGGNHLHLQNSPPE
jgi:amidophosphoribosyltransferase